MTTGHAELVAAIASEIAVSGPIPFVRFMELALYHPQFGYYTRSPETGTERIDWTGDFYTSSDVHPTLGQALARQAAQIDRLLAVKGNRSARELHRELGRLLWDNVGMGRNENGLTEALARIPRLREEFWHSVSVPGEATNINKNLEYAGRVADYLEFAELLALDALERRELCGGHFREESQTPEGEALRDDANCSYVAAWEFAGVGKRPSLHKEALAFEYVKPTQRSYK